MLLLQLEELKSENAILLALLEHHGIDTTPDASAQWASGILGKRFWRQKALREWHGTEVGWMCSRDWILFSADVWYGPACYDEVKGQEVSISTKHQEPLAIYSS